MIRLPSSGKYHNGDLRSNCHKKVLDYSIALTENNEIWNELLQGLVNHGITNVQLFIADRMVGLQNTIIKNYLQAKFQRCWVHVTYNLISHVRKNDRQQVINGFKIIRQAETCDQAVDKFTDFVQHWQTRYPQAIQQIQKYDDLPTFYDFLRSL